MKYCRLEDKNAGFDMHYFCAGALSYGSLKRESGVKDAGESIGMSIDLGRQYHLGTACCCVLAENLQIGNPIHQTLHEM